MISIDIKSTEDIQGTVTKILVAIDKKFNTSDVLDEAGALLLSRTRARFLKQLDPERAPWIPSQASIKREKSGRGGGTLFDTGRLFHSIQLFGSGGDERSIGTDVPYAAKHQLGEGTIKRQFLGISDLDIDAIERLLKKRFNSLVIT